MHRLSGILFFLLLSCTIAKAQYGTQKRADALFDKYAYVKAVESYKKLVERGYNVDHAKRRLADSYTFLRDPKNAVIYYKDVVEQPNVSIEYYLGYAHALRGIQNYDDARKWIMKYKDAGGDLKKVADFDKAESYNPANFKGSPKYTINSAPFNSEYSDFGAYEKDSIIYFASSLNEGVLVKRKYTWNQQPFLDLYSVHKNDTVFSHKNRIKGAVNTKFHEASISFHPKNNTLYFSRNNYFNSKRGRDDKRITHLQIFSAQENENGWENIKSLSINNSNYSVTHPAVSPDGNYLYFASDMPGGNGKMDIYKAPIKTDGSLGVPVNLGDVINTPGDDVFPFINSEGILSFSSDGHPGLGQLDIFTAIVNENGKYIGITNIGAPINSNADDFAFFANENGNEGYFTSNRGENIYDDDIYTFSKIPPLKVKGHVTDSLSNLPIANAIMVLKDNNGNLIAQVETNEEGYYETTIERDVDYEFTTLKEGYYEKVTPFTSKNISPSTTEIIIDVLLKRIPFTKEVFPVINNIYFNFDRSNVRKDAQEILDRVVHLMTVEYPKMKIKISSHTDSRGSSEYNIKLSQRRANATLEYLLDNGIEFSRILESKGYGEEKLITNCPNEVNCDEHEHQLNRRTEFLIISLR